MSEVPSEVTTASFCCLSSASPPHHHVGRPLVSILFMRECVNAAVAHHTSCCPSGVLHQPWSQVVHLKIAWQGRSCCLSAVHSQFLRHTKAFSCSCSCMLLHDTDWILQASRHAARALHICPWKPLQTALAARTSLDTSLSNSLAASCMSSSFSLNTLCRATQSYRVLPSDLPNEAAVMDMLAVRVTGAVTQPCASDAIEDVRAVYKVTF